MESASGGARMDGSFCPAPAAIVSPRSRAATAWHMVEMVLDWLDRSRQRRKLSELDDRMLRDIGVSRADIEAELSKPFWKR